MGAVTTAVPVAGTRMTLDDWLTLPESDERVELIEGVVAVTSSPSEPHQAIVTGLVVALARACPAEFRVRAGPLGVLVRDLTSGLLPDLVVVRADDRTSLDRLPALVVEVLSPSTRGRDQVEKRRLVLASRSARSGPAGARPWRARRLRPGRARQRIRGGRLDAPVPDPADLLG